MAWLSRWRASTSMTPPTPGAHPTDVVGKFEVTLGTMPTSMPRRASGARARPSEAAPPVEADPAGAAAHTTDGGRDRCATGLQDATTHTTVDQYFAKSVYNMITGVWSSWSLPQAGVVPTSCTSYFVYVLRVLGHRVPTFMTIGRGISVRVSCVRSLWWQRRAVAQLETQVRV